jgi:CheY-like chemotaxis protein
VTPLSDRKKVMIVDDSEIVLEVTRGALLSAGYDVVTHPRPTGCITLILQERPDLLLIDVNMPGLNGDTVVKMLASTRSNTEMVVLLHSSLPDEVLAQKAASARAHGYVRKSESVQDMVRQVARWIRPGTNSGTHQLRLAAPETSNRPSDSRLAASGKFLTPDRISGRILLADHDMVELSGLRKLLAGQPGTVEFALSGKEVLRRLQTDNPPDVVVLGRLTGSPSVDEVASSAARINARWKSRLIIVRDEALGKGNEALDALLARYAFTHLRRPLTDTSLCGAIQSCLLCAS